MAAPLFLQKAQGMTCAAWMQVKTPYLTSSSPAQSAIWPNRWLARQLGSYSLLWHGRLARHALWPHLPRQNAD